MFRNNDIPEGYNKLAEISDNYLVWVRESKLVSGVPYSAYIQYIYPSPGLLLIDNYYIKQGTSYNLEANYTNNGMYSYITDYDVNFELVTMSADSDYFNDSDYDRADFPNIFVMQVLLFFIFYFIFNKLSRLVFKGGL